MSIDRSHIIIGYDDTLHQEELFSFGEVANDLKNISFLYLRLFASDEDGRQLETISAVKGVLTARYNQNRQYKDVLKTAPIDSMQSSNAAIYAEMNMDAAWAITKGDPRIVIAVLDTGCDTRHPDLNAPYGYTFREGIRTVNNHLPMKVSIRDLCPDLLEFGRIEVCEYNPNRINPLADEPKIYVPCYTDSTCKTVLFSGDSLTSGAFGTFLIPDFWVNQAVNIRVQYDYGIEMTADVWFPDVGLAQMHDGYGHGTACVGVINGQHNAHGLKGIAPNCTTIPYRITDNMGGFNVMDFANAVNHAADHAHIISMSWGITPPEPIELASYAYAVAQGVIFLAAVGNEGAHPQTDVAIDYNEWPAAFDGVIGVGACGDINHGEVNGWIDYEPMQYDRISNFSQKNSTVSFLAPGDGWRLHAPLAHGAMWWGSRVDKYARYYNFQAAGGTSFSTPAAGGGVALMCSKKIENLPAQDFAGVRSYLVANFNTAVILGIISSTAKLPVKLSNGNAATVGFGAGRFNVGAAVAAV